MSFLSFRQQPETVVSTAFPSLEAWSHFPQLEAGDGHGQLVAQQFPHRLHRDPGVTVERHPAAPLAGMGKSIPSCQGEINRVFQPPPELRQGGIPSRGRKQGCFQPCRPTGDGPGHPYGLRDHAAGPMVLQCQGGEVYPRRVHGGVRPVAEMRGMSRDLLER